MSLIEIINIATENNISSSSENRDIYYTAKDLYKLYPNVFSKYKLDKYIKEEFLPVIKHGKERLFLKSEVEEWLRKRSDKYFNKVI